MRQKNRFIKSVLATAVALLSTQVNAAGFQLNEVSSAGLGRAFAGEAAIADTAASGNRNPATLMMFDRPTLSAGLIFIDPEVDISGKSAKGTNLEAKNIAPTAWVPNQHYVQPLNEQFAIGGSITSNYGLATKFNENYAAGAYGGTTDLLTANLNFSTAYRANEHFSLGLGVNLVYAKAKLERYAGEIASPVIDPTTQVVYMKGDDWGFGWNTGLLYEVNENHRFGLTYRSEVKIKFEGDYSSQLSSKLSIAGLPVGTDGQKIPGTLDLTLPEIWELSGFHKVHPQWAIHYSLAYTNWSSFKEIRAIASDGKTFFNKDENFDDSYRIALGTTYYYDSAWTFRAGVAFDDAASTKTPSISIPDQDRIWFTAGTSYALNQNASLDFGLAYMVGRKATFEEGLGNSMNAFEAKGSAWLIGTNFNYAF